MKTGPTTIAHGLSNEFRLDHHGNATRWFEYGNQNSAENWPMSVK
jgi:hypothetical protein